MHLAGKQFINTWKAMGDGFDCDVNCKMNNISIDWIVAQYW